MGAAVLQRVCKALRGGAGRAPAGDRRAGRPAREPRRRHRALRRDRRHPPRRDGGVGAAHSPRRPVRRRVRRERGGRVLPAVRAAPSLRRGPARLRAQGVPRLARARPLPLGVSARARALCRARQRGRGGAVGGAGVEPEALRRPQLPRLALPLPQLRVVRRLPPRARGGVDPAAVGL